MRFGKKRKLTSKRVGNVAYELELPQNLSAAHLVLQIYKLKNCLGDTSLIFPIEKVGIKNNLFYEEFLVHIFYRQV